MIPAIFMTPTAIRIYTFAFKALALVTLLWYVLHWVDDQRQAAVDSALAKREAEISAASARAQLRENQRALDEERVRAQVLGQQLVQEKNESQRRVSVFNQHNLGKLLQDKPGMIETRINAATEKVWAQIEGESK